ncbi:MAG TPA: phosphoethanolamine--lipid A transferase [Pseudomonadales bacterium]|nr:phosphoethanolamine--lipid A transferase [Pseudomonadales bacterium]
MACSTKLTSTQMIWLVSAWIVLLDNGLFWQTIWNSAGGWAPAPLAFIFSALVVAVALTNLLLNLLSFSWLTRIFLGLALNLCAIASYYMNHFNVLIDAEMIRNVVATDFNEALELINHTTFVYVLLLGVLPSLLMWRYLDVQRNFLQEAMAKLFSSLLSLLLMACFIFPLFPNYASLARNHRDLRLMLTPLNYVAGLFNVAKSSWQSAMNQPVLVPAARSTHWREQKKHAVFVLVVGETARSANFSLAGYSRLTNPELSQRDVIYFGNVHSCGTATAVSLPCMFSNMVPGGTQMAGKGANLLDVLNQSGFQLLWRDNNSGCKSVCDRIPFESMTKNKNTVYCGHGECFDEILLEGLATYIDHLNEDAVIVLHQKGSHGPAYFLRYPTEYERFEPVCRTSELQKCSQQEIINAYDNTLLYTDHVLAELIDLLAKKSDQVDTAMLYLSDHGESLGENNFYLHGAPYVIAPSEQTHIPMIAWLSQGFKQRIGLEWSCLQTHKNADLTHYHLFHSVLGLLQVQSPAYFQGLDIFHSCMRQPDP